MKLRYSILCVAMALGVAALAPTNSADAHATFSTWATKSSSQWFFFHSNPGKSTWNWVGYDPWGTPVNNMYSQVGDSTTTIRQDVWCNTGIRYGSWATIGAGTIYGSWPCSSRANLWYGRVGISH